MQAIKKIGLAALGVVVILWGLKFTSSNLRIEGYWGLLFEYLSPKHDTVFADEYTDKGFLKINKGMTEKEVLEILGEPIVRWEPRDEIVGFQYSESPSSTHYRLRQVYLKDKIVVERIGYYYID